MQGQAYDVEGHLHGADNYYVIVSTPDGSRRVPYALARDASGMDLYEARPFAPPISAIPRLDLGSFARSASGERWKILRAPYEQEGVTLVFAENQEDHSQQELLANDLTPETLPRPAPIPLLGDVAPPLPKAKPPVISADPAVVQALAEAAASGAMPGELQLTRLAAQDTLATESGALPGEARFSRQTKSTIRYFEAPNGKYSNAAQTIEAALRKDNPQTYHGVQAGFVLEVSAPNRYSAFVRVAERLTGVKVVFVHGANGVRLDFDGAYVGGRTLYVNRGATRPIQFIIGHEFTHYLKTKFPKIYEDLQEGLTAASNPSKAHKYAKEQLGFYQGRGNLLAGYEELYADTVGDAWADPAFWQQVMDRVSPSLIRRLKTAFLNFLMAIKSKFARTPETAGVYRDIDAVRQAVVSATAEAAQIWPFSRITTAFFTQSSAGEVISSLPFQRRAFMSIYGTTAADRDALWQSEIYLENALDKTSRHPHR